jgi:hypothetical protein
MTFPRALISAILLLPATFAGPARAQGPAGNSTQLSVTVGFGDRVRAGRWAPITIKASDAQTRAAVIDLYVPQAGTYAMRVRQYITLSPVPTTVQLYAPLEYGAGGGSVVTLRDADTGKTLARNPEDPDNTAAFYNRIVSTDHRLVGISGERTLLQVLGGQMGSTPVETTYLPPRLLPRSSIGYDSLDLLILNRPDLAKMEADQQKAILDWVHAGGNLLLWPGDDPLPDSESSQIVQALPCRVGGIQDYLLEQPDLDELGLPKGSDGMRNGLRGRALVPNPEVKGAEAIRLFSKSAGNAYSRQYGFGRIVVVPIDLSQLPSNPSGATRIWDPLLRGTGLRTDEAGKPTPGVGNTSFGADADAQRQQVAMRVLQDHLGNVPGLGQFGFSYVALVLIGMMVIVGPVDWFVLKMLGRQPWTWVTTTGWIALVTLGALYAGYVLKSGDLHYRTIRLVDQVGDQSAGEVDVAFIYSPKTGYYHLDAPGAAGGGNGAAPAAQSHDPVPGWWQPASVDFYSRGGIINDVDFHQTDAGNAPEAMLINVWNMRFLRGETSAPGPAVLDGKLEIKRGKKANGADTYRLAGSIKNLTDKPLVNLRVGTWEGFAAAAGTTNDPNAPLIARLEPNATAQVDAPIVAPPPENALPSLPNYGRYGPEPAQIPESKVWLMTRELAGRRAHRADVLMQTGAWATVYAERPNPEPPAVLREPGAKEQHYELIRAVVPIAGETGRPLNVPVGKTATDRPKTGEE